MFQVVFDFNLEKYKESGIKECTFSERQQGQITHACKLLASASARVVLPHRDAIRRRSDEDLVQVIQPV